MQIRIRIPSATTRWIFPIFPMFRNHFHFGLIDPVKLFSYCRECSAQAIRGRLASLLLSAGVCTAVASPVLAQELKSIIPPPPRKPVAAKPVVVNRPVRITSAMTEPVTLDLHSSSRVREVSPPPKRPSAKWSLIKTRAPSYQEELGLPIVNNEFVVPSPVGSGEQLPLGNAVRSLPPVPPPPPSFEVQVPQVPQVEQALSQPAQQPLQQIEQPLQQIESYPEVPPMTQEPAPPPNSFTHQATDLPPPVVSGPAHTEISALPQPAPCASNNPCAQTPVYPQVPPTQTVKANTQRDGSCLLTPYRQRANHSNQAYADGSFQLDGIPASFQAWWSEQALRPLIEEQGQNRPTMQVSLDALLHAALVHSPHVQIAATEPHIRRTQVFIEAAEFDWRDFLETKYNDTNDPIGNTLITGNDDDRFVEQEWYGVAGVRKRNRVGGELELTQRLGHLTNNSIFLVPPNQGNSRLQLNYRQPLLQSRGRPFNESLILLAKIDYNVAGDDFLGSVQSHLVKVTEVYWELVRARAEYLQKQKALKAAQRVLVNLEGRRELDVLDRQVLRARAAVETRRAEIARAKTSIRNAESQLRLLVNDPSWNYASNLELLPVDTPLHEQYPVELADALSTALTYRPDISKAIRELRAANIQLGVAQNQVLPRLDMLVGTYVAGLDGNSDIFNSWVNQFRDGQPGFNVGLEFELPRGNRAAEARERRRKWELSRAYHQFRAVVESSMTEVEIAVRETATAHQELVGRYHSMMAAAKENRYLYDRWQTLPGANDSATLLLEDFLESQLRLALEEGAFAQAQADYVIATVALKEAMGTLTAVVPH